MESNLARLEEAFFKMESDGFDTKIPLKWGFFFVDKDKQKLENVYSELKDHSYRIEEFVKAKDNYWQLKVVKIEVLTPDKLHRRNIAFNGLANHYSVETYDGWEVEKSGSTLK